ncbi:MAG: hypothetical protein R6U96_08810 [Promethearchaeia archaeon]
MEKLGSNIVRTIPDSERCYSWRGWKLSRRIQRNEFYRDLRKQIAKNREFPFRGNSYISDCKEINLHSENAKFTHSFLEQK